MTKKEYCLGFTFSEDLEKILLIKKSATCKVESLRNKLNGVGGCIEIGETPLESMIRECEEEAGLVFKSLDWLHFCTLSGSDSTMWCFCVATDEVFYTKQREDEYLAIYDVENTDGCFAQYKEFDFVPNLNWLIPMAINRLKNVDGVKCYMIEESYNVF